MNGSSTRIFLCILFFSFPILAAEKLNPPEAYESEAPVDQKFSQEFLSKAERLHAAGGLTPVSTLREQLSRKKARINTVNRRPKKQLTAAEIYQEIRLSVVAVGSLYKCTRCTRWHMSNATGFFISSDGALVTNYHVVDHADHEAILIYTADGRIYPVKEVLAADKETDLAILKVEGTGFTSLSLATDTPVGSPVYVLSHPDGHFYTFSEGMVSRYFRNPKGTLIMAITADYGKGSSGAPVVNERGQVAGVVASTQSLYYDVEGGKKDNLQMVFKNCAAVKGLHSLME